MNALRDIEDYLIDVAFLGLVVWVIYLGAWGVMLTRAMLVAR